MESAIKTAKKILKKEDGGFMKIKDLTQAVLEKLSSVEGGATNSTTGSNASSKDEIKSWILANDKFTLNGKLVSLSKDKKKRKNVENAEDESSSKKGGKKAKKEPKKSKKNKEQTSESSSFANSEDLSIADAVMWRKEHKIVLKSATDDEEGNKLSEMLNKNEAYIPYTNFNSERIKSSVDDVFLKHCTQVNKFTKPSAIQSQCWPVLLHPGSDGKRRDIVG